MAYYNIGANTLASGYTPGGKFPFDAREIVATFNDLLDEGTFKSRVYEGMRVVVIDECCIYELVSTTTDGSNNKNDIINQFVEKIDETTDLSPNKKLWKRLTIETITTEGALTRAKDNLVNGALIYIANDITLDDGTIQKSGLYFCQNVDGDGVLTMAGGGELEDGAVTAAKIGNNAVTTDKIDDNAVTGAKIDTGAVNADKLDQTFLNSLATKAQYDALTDSMEVGEDKNGPKAKTIANAINYAIYGVLNTPL